MRRAATSTTLATSLATALALAALPGALAPPAAAAVPSGAPPAAAGPGAPPRAAAAPRTITLLYVADLGGTLEPCGCSADQRGGLPRLAAAVAAVRREAPGALLLAGGDLLFEGPLAPERAEADRAKARATAEALRAMGLSATVIGERDRLAGEPFLRERRLPAAAAPRGRRLGDVAFGPLGAVPGAPVRVAVVHEGGSAAAVGRAAEAAAQGIHLLLAAHREVLTDDDVNRVVPDAAVPVVQVQGRGQSLARIDVRLAGDLSKGFVLVEGAAEREAELDLLGEREREYRRRAAAAAAEGAEGAAAARALGGKADELRDRAAALRAAPLPAPPDDRPSIAVRFIPVVEALPEDPAVRRLLARAYADVSRANLAAARARPRPCPEGAPGEARYTGTAERAPGAAGSCRECHPRAFAAWRATPHARAYATLVHAASGPRQHDLDCVACHVTGWRAPGGACSVAAVRGREDVQCEACHGPASLHAAAPPGHIERDPPEATCRRCHTPEHSSAFDAPVYRRKILAPGHGAP